MDSLTYYYKAEEGIENYATYEVTVAGFTVAGDGPSEKHLVGEFSFGVIEDSIAYHLMYYCTFLGCPKT